MFLGTQIVVKWVGCEVAKLLEGRLACLDFRGAKRVHA
jgi:hypothetical protein